MSIPSIPNLPTDNLYKFISIFGIVIVIASTLLSAYYEETTFQENLNLERRHTSYDNTVEFNTRLFEFCIKDRFTTQKSRDSLLKIPTAENILRANQYQKFLDSTKNIIMNYAFNGDSLRKVKEKLDDDFKFHDLKNKRGFAAYSRYWLLYFIIGCACTVTGFTLWYFKVQRYQDRILKKDAEVNKN